jgi:hypothetical protein
MPSEKSKTSRQVSIEDSVQYTGSNIDELAEVAGNHLVVVGRTPMIIVKTAEDYPLLPVQKGHWVIRFGANDMGAMSDGAYHRWFGDFEAWQRRLGES